MPKFITPAIDLASVIILGAAILAVGCSTAQQQKDVLQKVDQVVAVAKVVTDSGLVDPKTAAELQAASDEVMVAKPVVAGVIEEVSTMDMVVVQPHDTLWGIAAKAYAGHIRAPRGKGGFLWPLLCYENNLNNCNLIKPFQILRVPKPETVASMPVSQVETYLDMAYRAK